MIRSRVKDQGVHGVSLLLMMLVFAVTLDAQGQEYRVGTNINLVTGGHNNPNALGVGSTQASQPLTSFYAAYPTIALTSTGTRSSLNASYAFGLDWTDGDPDFRSNSHQASITLSRRWGSRWNVSLSESFLVTSDATTFNALRGVTPAAEDIRFLFDPVAVRRSATTNTASISTDYRRGRSTTSFNVSHSLRHYSNDELFLGSLSDQQGLTGGVSYTRQTSSRDAWTFGYTAAYFSFQNFENAASHSGRVGYSAQIAPNLTARLSVGASRLQSQGTGGSYTGYDTSVRLERAVRENSFSLYYTQETGQPSGLGSTSDTRRVGIAMRQRLGRADLFLDASVFDARGTLENPLETRGVSGAASIGLPLTETLSIHGGAQYQRYDQTAAFGFTQNRFFISLRYINPSLWRFF